MKHLILAVTITVLVILATTTKASLPVQDAVYSVAWSPDGTKIAVSGGIRGCVDTPSDQLAIHIFDVESGRNTQNLMGMICTGTSLDWSPDGTQVVSINEGQGTAYIWDVSSEQLLSTKPIRNIQFASSIVWSPAGDLIAVTSPINTITAWNPTTGEIVFILGGSSIDWNPIGTEVVFSSDAGGDIYIQEISNSEIIRTLRANDSYNYNVDWSDDGSKIAARGSDHRIRIWDADSGQLILDLLIENIIKVQFSPNGQEFASLDIDGNIQIWDARTEIF